MTTLPSDIESALRSYDLKPDGGDEWRCNSPIRPGANSHSFRINAVTGEWYDHVSEDKGNFYNLREALRLPQPSSQTGQATDTKRTYRDLDEYALDHGITGDVLRTAGFSEKTTYQNRPALIYPTATGKRVRFIDGQKPKYKPMETGIKACWYGLKRAVEMNSGVIVLCNGEVSTITAQYFKIPAFALTGGEKRIPDGLLNELKGIYTGRIIIALDCDTKGQQTASQIATQLSTFASPVIVDLNLTTGGDLADWCKLHTDQAAQSLYALASEKPAHTPPDVIETRTTTATPAAQSADEYLRRLNGAVMDGTPVYIPFKSFHVLGGYAKVLSPGKIAGIIAPSGHGKTSFLETWGDMLNRAGYDGVWHGDEWTPSEYHERRIQRYGGATLEQMNDFEVWKHQGRLGIPDGQRLGEALSLEVDLKSQQITQQIKQWRGQMTYFPGAGRAFDLVLEDMARGVAELRQTGRAVTFAMFDYVQLFEPSRQDDTVNRHEYALELVKRWAQANNLVAFVGSQVRKTETRDSKNNRLIDGDGALYIRDDKFNLFISLNVQYIEETDANGINRKVRTGLGTANITKNSSGRTGEIPLLTGFDKFSWHEAQS